MKNIEKKNHHDAQKTSRDQEEAYYDQAKTGSSPSHALAEKETRLDQTESDCLGEEEGPQTQTSDHPEKQKIGYHQKKENDPYETNQDPENALS